MTVNTFSATWRLDIKRIADEVSQGIFVSPATIADMTAIPDAELTDGRVIVVSDQNRGGIFEVLDGTPASNGLTADGGTVFASDGGGKTLWRLFSYGSIRAEWWGADPTGASDSASALNSAIDYLRDAVTQPTILSRNYYLDGSGAVFRVNSSLNATGITLGRGWGIKHLHLDAHCAGAVALDFTASRFGHLIDIHIWGDQTDTPKDGMLFAPASTQSTNPCSHWLMENCSTDGYFLNSGLHHYATEEVQAEWCKFWNRRVADGSGESWGAILSGTDVKAPTSAFQTVDTGRRSYTVCHWDHCSFQKPFGIAGPTMFWQDLANHKFTNCYVTNGSGAGVVWRLTAFVPYAIDGEFQMETTGNDTFMNFTSDSASAREIDGLRIAMGNVYSEDQFFLLDTLTALTIDVLKLDIRRWNSSAPTNNVFNNKAIVTLNNADIIVPSFNDFGDALTYAGFTGRVIDYSGVGVRIYGEQILRRGKLTLSDGNIQSNASLTMSDDTAQTVPIPAGTTSGVLLLWSSAADISAMIMYRADSTPIVLLSTLGTLVDTVNGTTLTGTTGTDGRFTVAVNNGAIMLENRRGFTVTARWQFVAS